MANKSYLAKALDDDSTKVFTEEFMKVWKTPQALSFLAIGIAVETRVLLSFLTFSLQLIDSSNEDLHELVQLEF